jgi:hypothetical protein
MVQVRKVESRDLSNLSELSADQPNFIMMNHMNMIGTAMPVQQIRNWTVLDDSYQNPSSTSPRSMNRISSTVDFRYRSARTACAPATLYL